MYFYVVVFFIFRRKEIKQARNGRDIIDLQLQWPETCSCDALLLACEQSGLLSARRLSQKLIGRSFGNRIKLLCYIWHQFRAGKPLCTFTIINGKPLACSVGCLPLRMCERFAVLSWVVPTEPTFDCWAVSKLLTRCLSPLSSKLSCVWCSPNKWHLQNVLPLIIEAIWLKPVTFF